MGWDQINFECVGSLNSEIPTCLNSNNLNTHTYWESPPNSTFPIELIFNIPPSKIGLIEILAHEFKAPSKVVVYITNSDRWKPIGYFEFKGSFKPKSHRQREMKHVFLPITDYFYTCFKLKFYSPRKNTSNINNQVSIYAIHLWGILQNEGIISLSTNDDPLKYEDLLDSNYQEFIEDEHSECLTKSSLNLKMLKESIKELGYISLLIDHESQLLDSLQNNHKEEEKDVPQKSESPPISNGTASIDELLNDLETKMSIREDIDITDAPINKDYNNSYQSEQAEEVNVINLANISDIESTAASVSRQNNWNFKSKTSSTELYCPIDIQTNNNQALETLSTKETLDTCLDAQATIYPEHITQKDIHSTTPNDKAFYQMEQPIANATCQLSNDYPKTFFLTPGPTTNNDYITQMETGESTGESEHKEKTFTDFVRTMMDYPDSNLSSFVVTMNSAHMSSYSSEFTDDKHPSTGVEQHYYFTPKKNINYDRANRARLEYLGLDPSSNVPIPQERHDPFKRSLSSPNYHLSSSPTVRSRASSLSHQRRSSDITNEYNKIYKTPISKKRYPRRYDDKIYPTPHPNQKYNISQSHLRNSRSGGSNPEERYTRSFHSDSIRSPLSERYTQADNEFLISNIFGDEIKQLVYSKHKGHRFMAIDNIIGAFKGHERSTIAQKGLGVIVGKSIWDSSFEIADRGLEVLEELEMKYVLSRSFYQPVIEALAGRIGAIPKILSDKCEEKIRNLSYTGMFNDIINFYLNGDLGLDNAGKSSLVANLLNQPLDQVAPTLGFKIYTYRYEQYNLNIWDIGGQKSIRSFWKNYFYKTDWLIWVIDSADRQRINDCKIEFNKLLSNHHLLETMIVILANKQDIPGAMSIDEISEFMEIDKLPNYKIIPTSAIDTDEKPKNLYNLLDSFKLLLENAQND